MVFLRDDIQVTKTDFFKSLIKSTISPKHYYQVAMGFDIETTSYLNKNGEKRGTMYIWQMCYTLPDITEFYYVYGRTWDEWEDFINDLKTKLELGKNRQKLVIYVHNLGFEHQWIYSHLNLNKTFARKPRHPISAESHGLIFKCSYFLSNSSLRNLAKNRGYTLKETMDYSIKRLWCTPLTKEEISYALVDVKILAEYIKDEIKRNNGIENIPLTQTGYARNYCRDYITEHTNFVSYNKRVREMLPKSEQLFFMMLDAYSGGFTHSNYIHTGMILEDVKCVDFTSSYPAVMCRKRFPTFFHMADPNPRKSFMYEGMAKIMIIEFTKISAITPHSILSVHKCKVTGEKVDNGRLRYAETLKTTITDLDFDIISKFYKWEEFHIETLYVADYQYLPRELIMAILDLYKNKTTLKGVIGKEDLYLRSKEIINAIYGMSVTNPLNDEITFNEYGIWDKVPADVQTGLDKYNSNTRIFTAYQWGVWVTAWARYELLNTVYKIGDDVVYCDTDSIKYIGNHDNIIDEDNIRILKENSEIQKQYKIPTTLYSPKTIEGEAKTLGLWDKEPEYKYFKTLGAKRYVYSYNDKYFEKNKKKLKTDDNFFITVAGLPKESGKRAILELAVKYQQSPYDIFDFENEDISSDYYLDISENNSGKSTFMYLNETFSEEETDYLGNKCTVFETSFVYVKAIPFKLNLTDEYIALLLGYELETNMGASFTDPRERSKRNA